jgi:hypothetical protein
VLQLRRWKLRGTELDKTVQLLALRQLQRELLSLNSSSAERLL